MTSVLSRLSAGARAETAAGIPLISDMFPECEHDRVERALRAEHSRTEWWPMLGSSAPEAAEFTHHGRAGRKTRHWWLRCAGSTPRCGQR